MTSVSIIKEDNLIQIVQIQETGNAIYQHHIWSADLGDGLRCWRRSDSVRRLLVVRTACPTFLAIIVLLGSDLSKVWIFACYSSPMVVP